MMDSRLELAARNNARWCDAVCAAHGRPGEFRDAFWFNPGPLPPFYPNGITLSLAADLGEIGAQFSQFLAQQRSPRFSVKDSFCSLDLAPLGFHVLFEAMWIWRPPETRRLPGEWRIIDDESGLADWEFHWRAQQAEPLTRSRPMFPAKLFTDQNLRFLARGLPGTISGGAILYRSDEVVGISNFFRVGDNADDLWPALASAATTAFPNLPLVGFERGDDLIATRRAGFQELGPLRVWTT
jgi:hypothetical protein